MNLAHSKNLTDIRPCEDHQLRPIRLSGVGGMRENALRQAGVVQILTDAGETRKATAYVVDEPIAGDKQICLLGL